MDNDLKTWQAPKLSTLDVDQTLTAGWWDHTEGSYVSGYTGLKGKIIDGIGNFGGTPGGS